MKLIASRRRPKGEPQYQFDISQLVWFIAGINARYREYVRGRKRGSAKVGRNLHYKAQSGTSNWKLFWLFGISTIRFGTGTVA